jgi:hypothetical protein
MRAEMYLGSWILDLGERVCMDWIGLVQDGDKLRELVNVVINHWVPSIRCWEIVE